MVIGLLFGVVVHRKLDERTLLTIVVGMVLLGGGFAFALGVSAIFVNFVVGFTFARTSSFAGQATDTMRSIKHPFDRAYEERYRGDVLARAELVGVRTVEPADQAIT